jgi:hypothetical protein
MPVNDALDVELGGNDARRDDIHDARQILV